MTEGDTAPVSDTVATPAPEPVTDTGDNEVIDTPREIKTDPIQAKEPVEKKPVSTLDAVKKAAEKIEAGEKAKPATDKQPVKPVDQAAVKAREAPATVEATKPQEAPKTAATDDAKPYKTPPSRWNPEAKAAWEAMPDDNLKNEVYRTVSELEKGYNKHREGAEKWNALREYDEMARKANTDIPSALKTYTAIDKDLNSSSVQDKLRAIDHIFKTAGIDKAAFAKHVLGNQQPQQQSNIQHVPAQQQDSPVVRQLQQEIAALKQQTEGVTRTIQQQQDAQIDQEWQAWSKDKPLANDLLDPMQYYLNEGLDLDEAYERAKGDLDERLQSLGYAPMNTRPAAQAIPNGRTTKSLSGAPSAGSTPGSSPRSKNPADAVKRAMQIAGMM